MKLQDVVIAEQLGLLSILRNLPLSDRQHRYQLRHGLEVIGKELTDAYAERDLIITEVEPETKSIPMDHPRFAEVNKRIADYWGSESKEKIEPCIHEIDLEHVQMSVAQEIALETLGLLIGAEPPAPEAEKADHRAERMHVPPKSGKK